MPVTIKRKTVQFNPDSKRVIPRFLGPGGDDRARVIIQMVLTLSYEERTQLLNQVLREFSTRHRNITIRFEISSGSNTSFRLEDHGRLFVARN